MPKTDDDCVPFNDKCPICLEDVSLPVMMPCEHHVVCLACVHSSLINSVLFDVLASRIIVQEYNCPICRGGTYNASNCGIEGVTAYNIAATERKSKAQRVKCPSCTYSDTDGLKYL